MLKRIISCIPNTITCLNLVSGGVACYMACRPGETFGGYSTLSLWAIFICLAAVFDFADGASARLLKAYSALGKELDSLSDLVSFGLAPALMVLNTMMAHGEGWISFFALFIAAMGALRLAKFNIDDRQTTSFIGLPIPANAIFWVGAIYWMQLHFYPGAITTLILVAAMGLLMVSELSMFSLKFKNFRFGENVRRYALILAAILFVAFEGVPGLSWTIIFYILLAVAGRFTAPATENE